MFQEWKRRCLPERLRHFHPMGARHRRLGLCPPSQQCASVSGGSQPLPCPQDASGRRLDAEAKFPNPPLPAPLSRQPAAVLDTNDWPGAGCKSACFAPRRASIASSAPLRSMRPPGLASPASSGRVLPDLGIQLIHTDRRCSVSGLCRGLADGAVVQTVHLRCNFASLATALVPAQVASKRRFPQSNGSCEINDSVCTVLSDRTQHTKQACLHEKCRKTQEQAQVLC